MINITKTFLPTQEEYNAILKRAWDTGWMTNRGVLVQELEAKLKTYLDIPHIIATTNGTLPIQIAIKALGLTGDIITTPFSYVATTSSIVWEGCKPVFVDIHPDYLTIDETKIEAAITDKTSAILATHVFGNPCAVEDIEQVAKKHNLKVIYDAAHCFGVTFKGKSIFEYGDVSTCSFHATKLFHTGEGGAMFAQSKELHDRLYYYHNFGHKNKEEYHGLGINAKMSELQAALGLAVFPYMETIIEERKKIVDFYNENINFELYDKLRIREDVLWNFSYFPIVFDSEDSLLRVLKQLNNIDVFPRRYFYPSLENLPYINKRNCEVASDISKKILCLPLFVGLQEEDLIKITEIINNHI
ncbi:DegT/DnrJ/EryC1/StrS family aminotransferase [Winogradskyella bathintestinalis]|uniref:DegT/DnrJ/EryC1/StrS family aminotransferase n=1 Tax=Winogradskyella bathintestinalis TaxID=3035208 RepID=A0ABT7ZTV2_9FLAO|nr:DegT/DnrJ/EryC1/StrS family aminotransferase [Winogradskyella bathintestinalis]MDN3492437.1 DegT/DnrJ/EryC1/StrS family aminotransferase [Winogradskyella bathintestinalis]